VVVAAGLGSMCLMAASAAATVIHVNTTRETAVFAPHVPGSPNVPSAYNSTIVGDDSTATECSLRQAINSANTHTAHFGCPAGSGNDTIELPAGTYHVQDNFFIEEKMTFVGPNAGLAGNDPNRGPEAVLSFDNNPNWSAQVAMFWLDQPSDTGDAKGAGTSFDGVEMQGGFVPDCNVSRPCEIMAIVQPSKIDQEGYTLTNSILRDFSVGVYLGGRDTLTRDLFEDDRANPAASANGWDIYSDWVYMSHDTIIDDNVFKNPDLGGIILQNGDGTRSTVSGAQVEHNLFLKEENHDLGLFLLQTSGVVIKDNLFYGPSPPPLPDRLDTAIRMDHVDHVQITANTMTGWGNGIKIGGIPLPGPEGSTDDTIAFNRIYDNLYGVRVESTVTDGDYGPLAVDANDNWWGANGGPGSTGARPGAIQPVNGVQFFDSDGNPVPNQGGLTVDRWLHLTCSVPATVEVNVPAPVIGQVLGMPTVNVTSSTPPWFFDHADPLMAASAPGVGNVFGFDQVPDQGPNNAQLTGTLLATNTGSGDVLVDLDSERVACPLTVTPGPNPDIGKDPDSPAVMAGGLAGFRITVTNRGSVTAHDWWVCDRIPRHMTFVRASRKLRRLGSLRCLVVGTLRPHQRVSFHVTLRVASNAPSTLTNTGDVIPGPPAGIPEPPTGSPAPPGAPPPVKIPIKKTGSKVKVRHPAPVPPPLVTG
jgi:uncharacterized repeat protein (TIGR01451 family)